jgi:threonine synthase
VSLPTWFECAGCGYRHPDGEPALLACPRARPGDDIDHVLTHLIDPARVSFPPGGGDVAGESPFARYRRLFHAWHAARALGWRDEDYVGLVERLDVAVARVDGRGFRETSFVRAEALSESLGFSAAGGVLVKDETVNVSGSHKGRHFMGTLLELEVAEAVRLARGAGGPGPGDTAPADDLPPLAIASCGNAALAAAVVARAAGRVLDVFIPVQADPAVVARLRDLGARIHVCERTPGAPPGDPVYHALLAARSAGAVAFTGQGNLNGLAAEGGATLAYEMASRLASGPAPYRLDRVFVQVGGGGLAASIAQGFEEALALGVIDRLPRLHAVQTRSGFPLARAYGRVVERLGAGRPAGSPGSPGRLDLEDPAVSSVLAHAARHRSEFMWPWEEEPRSIATGILDDETYDWLAVVRGMLASGGSPVVVDEPTLVEAHDLARSATGIDVDPTGSSGLAGLVELRRRDEVHPDESVAVLFTGVTRRA